MNLTSASITAAITARAVPVSATLPVAGKRLSATATIGGSTAISYPLADIAYAYRFFDGDGDTADLDLLTGEVTVTGGATISPATAIDFSGVALPTAATLYAIRLTAAAENAGVVGITMENGGLTNNFDVTPGQVVLLAYTDLALLADDHMLATFSAAGDSITVEVIAGT